MPEATGAEATAVVLDNGEQLPTLDAYLQLAKSKPGTRLILEMNSLSKKCRPTPASTTSRAT